MAMHYDEIYNKANSSEQNRMALIRMIIRKEGLKDYGQMDFDE